MPGKSVVPAVLGVDGNEGYAMIGDGSEIGPAAFEPIASDDEPGSDAWVKAAVVASQAALRKLQQRFPDKELRGRWSSE
jgi:hypothetical protein